MKPHFLIAGATRCGTTTLYEVLKRNEGIFMPEKKELQFFYRTPLYEEGIEAYEHWFDDAKDGQVIGEASPPYMDHAITLGEGNAHVYDEDNDARTRILRHYPDIKLIFSLRNPIDRLYSTYVKAVWGGWEKTSSFEKAVAEEMNGERTAQNTKMCYLYRNDYAVHMRPWLESAKKDHMRVYIFEEWTKEPARVIHDIETFIGALPQPLKDSDIQSTNEGRSIKNSLAQGIIDRLPRNGVTLSLYRRFLTDKGYAPMKHKTRAMLLDYFEPKIQEMENLLDINLDIWRQ